MYTPKYRPSKSPVGKIQWQCSSLAFGDFVIDCNFMRRAGPKTGILAASYLEPLARALEYPGRLCFFDMPATDVPPSIWNVRRARLGAILRSAIALMRGIRRVLPAGDTLTLPTRDIRWKAICWPRRIEFTREPGENIYFAYIARLGIDPNALLTPLSSRPASVLILPESRQIARNLSEETVQRIVAINREVGVRSLIVRVRPPGSGPPLAENEVELWGLSSMIESVKMAEAVVSADSLPVHLAAYFMRPAFVFTPVPRASWPQLPASVLLPGAWSDTTDMTNYRSWLTQND
jgi:hypothetical protein